MVINSPSNPTGSAYTGEELAALGEVLRRHPHVLIATDDMYEHILWTAEPFVNILNVCPDLYERTMVLNGVSKAYSMTGWRIGYAGGPATLIEAMKNVQSQSTSNPTSISQVAAQAALDGDQSCITRMCKAFKERHDFVVGELNTIPGVRCIPGQGTFYTFPNVEGMIDRLDGLHIGCGLWRNSSLMKPGLPWSRARPSVHPAICACPSPPIWRPCVKPRGALKTWQNDRKGLKLPREEGKPWLST